VCVPRVSCTSCTFGVVPWGKLSPRVNYHKKGYKLVARFTRETLEKWPNPHVESTTKIASGPGMTNKLYRGSFIDSLQTNSECARFIGNLTNPSRRLRVINIDHINSLVNNINLVMLSYEIFMRWNWGVSCAFLLAIFGPIGNSNTFVFIAYRPRVTARKRLQLVDTSDWIPDHHVLLRPLKNETSLHWLSNDISLGRYSVVSHENDRVVKTQL
jgi:hypothetical protein